MQAKDNLTKATRAAAAAAFFPLAVRELKSLNVVGMMSEPSPVNSESISERGGNEKIHY